MTNVYNQGLLKSSLQHLLQRLEQRLERLGYGFCIVEVRDISFFTGPHDSKLHH